MSIDKVSPAGVNNEFATGHGNNVVRPKTFEMMTDAEVDEVMAERRRKREQPEWGRNRFGDPRPMSAWDRIDD